MKKILNLFMVCTAFCALLVTSCKDYSGDIEALNTELQELQEQQVALDKGLTEAKNAANTASDAASKAKAEAVAEAVAQAKAYADNLDKDNVTKTELAELAGKVDALSKTVSSLSTLESTLKKYADDAVAKVASRVTTIETQIAALQKYEARIKANEEDIKDNADDIAANLKKIEAIEKAIAGLDDLKAKVKTLEAELAKKVNSADFEAYKTTVKTELDNIDTDLTKVQNDIKAINANIVLIQDKLLRSLVFIPELYVDGIEADEYNFVWYAPLTKSNVTLSGKNFEQVDVDGTVPAYTDNTQGNKTKWHSFNPVQTVEYHLNPSTANVSGVTLDFISNDAAVINTKASVAAPAVDSYSSNNGILSVNMTANGVNSFNTYEAGKASVYALNADVPMSTGKYATVTSDYARLYPTYMTPKALAFDNKTGATCSNGLHLYKTMKEAVESEHQLEMEYTPGSTLNILDFLEMHLGYNKPAELNNQPAEVVKVWNAVSDAKTIEKYGFVFNFQLIDYKVGSNETNDSKYAQINKTTGVMNPCAVDANGNQITDSNLQSSIGRCPVVLVTVTRDKDVVLHGFIKVKIVKTVKAHTTAAFNAPDAKFGCNNYTYEMKWEEVSYKVLEAYNNSDNAEGGISKDQFDLLYEISADASGVLYQYAKSGDGKLKSDWSKVASSKVYGTVKEVPDPTSTTTSVLQWTLAPKDMQNIWEKSGHKVTIYVGYRERTTGVAENEPSIFIPITVKVTKPTGSVVEKIKEYWFGNSYEKAMINVARPTDGGSTLNWVTDIDQVWLANAPTFKPTSGYPSYSPAALKYKYYFAPEQPAINVNGQTYQLKVSTNKAFDKWDGSSKAYKNSEIQKAELDHALDITKGLYTNTTLLYNNEVIAELDQATGKVTYKDGNIAKLLLNASASVERSEAKLYANIGVTAYSPCNIALSLANAINPYYFLRPINLKTNGSGVFLDGQANGSEVHVADLIDIVDWRKVEFTPRDAQGTITDYSNVWLYAYYNVNSITVKTDEATCNLNNSSTFKKMSDVTSFIELTYVGRQSGQNTSTWAYAARENTVAGSTKDNYEVYRTCFGKLVYKNNGNNVKSFQIKVPIEITYDWGTLASEITLTVQETMGNN